MRAKYSKGMRFAVAAIALLTLGLLGNGCPIGISQEALDELADAGVNQYLGAFQPISSQEVGDGWTQHDFDPNPANGGPSCIIGSPYSVFTRAGDPHKLLIFEQGGGACWQDFYFCSVNVEGFPPPGAPGAGSISPDQRPPFAPVGIWDFANPDNPFADYSVVYMPYCDGSVFTGDNDVPDASFPFGPFRFHRGLINQSAGMDVAKALFPEAVHVTVAGSSAGGVGATGFAPALVRFLYGNNVLLSVFNDAGPVAVNLNETDAIAARAADWNFGRFFPASCTECSDLGQSTAIIEWRLDNDTGIREAFYETDGDQTNRFFLNVPTQQEYRDLILAEHGALNEEFPLRYKTFILSGDASHTALQSPIFYTQTADVTLFGKAKSFVLNEWTRDFLQFRLGWKNLVEDFAPLP